MKYEDRLIAFLDILGFSNSVYKASNEEASQTRLYEMLEELRKVFLPDSHSQLSTTLDQANIFDRQVSQASDSIIFSCKLSAPGGVLSIIDECARVNHIIIRYGFLVRGVISFGELYHHNDILFGPAFIDAYKAESREKLPVIKFNREILDIAYTFPSLAQLNHNNIEINYINEYCAPLDGDYFFIDYFNNYNDSVGCSYIESRDYYEILRDIIHTGILKAKTWSIFKKMNWAKKKFNLCRAIQSGIVSPINTDIYKVRKFKLYITHHLRFSK